MTDAAITPNPERRPPRLDELVELEAADVHWIAHRLPRPVRDLFPSFRGEVVLAGGFIRACITGEEPQDVDLFVRSREVATRLAAALESCDKSVRGAYETPNAITLHRQGIPVQIVKRWTYANPRDVVPDFDFTVCAAAMWWDLDVRGAGAGTSGSGWFRSAAHPRFYRDLAAKRLWYSAPNRDEAPGGSLLRFLKYGRRGYRGSMDDLALLVQRVTAGISEPPDSPDFLQLLRGRLFEVDPAEVTEP